MNTYIYIHKYFIVLYNIYIYVIAYYILMYIYIYVYISLMYNMHIYIYATFKLMPEVGSCFKSYWLRAVLHWIQNNIANLHNKLLANISGMCYQLFHFLNLHDYPATVATMFLGSHFFCVHP